MPSEPLGALPIRLDPSLPIHGVEDVSLVDFWRWGYSDVLSNGVRGVLGEYLVGKALGVTDRPRVEWDAVDLHYGPWRIEAKTTSAHQAWPLAPGSRASSPGFDVGSRRGWDASTGLTSPAGRSADCYVFCVYTGPEAEPTTNLDRRIAVLDVRR
jgi:hypothetical protein